MPAEDRRHREALHPETISLVNRVPDGESEQLVLVEAALARLIVRTDYVDQVPGPELAGRGDGDTAGRDLLCWALRDETVGLLFDHLTAFFDESGADSGLELEELSRRASDCVSLLLRDVALHDLDQEVRLRAALALDQ